MTQRFSPKWLPFVAPIVLLASMFWFDEDRFQTRKVETEAAAPALAAASAEQVAAMCEQAILPLEGVRARMPATELEALLRKAYGPAAVQTLMTSHRDRRVVPTEDALFFPNRHLCSQGALTGRCADLCRAYMQVATP